MIEKQNTNKLNINKYMKKYAWQGEPIKVDFGHCTVKLNKEKPLWWYNFDCSSSDTYGISIIPAIKITTSFGNEFCIANHFGIGHHKLIHGGWPNYTHYSLDMFSFEVSKKPEWRIIKFDLEGYENWYTLRQKWEKENFPEEFNRMENFRW